MKVKAAAEGDQGRPGVHRVTQSFLPTGAIRTLRSDATETKVGNLVKVLSWYDSDAGLLNALVRSSLARRLQARLS